MRQEQHPHLKSYHNWLNPSTQDMALGQNAVHRDIFDIGAANRVGLAPHSLTNPLNPTAFSPRKFAMNLMGTGIGVWGAADVTNYEGADYEGNASFFHLRRRCGY